jgi:hypothetical protein
MCIVFQINVDDPKYLTKNLAGIIKMNLETLEELGVVRASVSVANDNLYGSYSIPLAIGFATPVHILKGATIVFSDDTSETSQDLFTLLKLFLKTYGCNALTKKIIPFSHNTSYTNCVICTNDYDIGDIVFDLPCKHRYHYNCLGKYISTICDVPRCANFADHMKHVSFGCNSTAQATCPICNVLIAV